MDTTMTDVGTPKITRDGKTWHTSLPADDGQTIDVQREWCSGRPVRETACLVLVMSFPSA